MPDPAISPTFTETKGSTTSTTPESSAAISNSNVLVGGKVLIKMQGQTVGFAQSARCTDNYRYQPVHVVGQLQAVEYVPMAATHEIVLEMMVMKNDSLTRHNLEPWGAGSFGYLSDGVNIGGITGTADTYNTIGAGVTTGARVNTIGSTNYNAIEYGIKQQHGGTLTVIDGKTFTIAITDAQSGKNIVEYKKCYYASGGFSIGANNIVGHQVTFYAIYKIGQMDAGSDSGLTENYRTASSTSAQ